jgi:hypothetical protein
VTAGTSCRPLTLEVQGPKREFLLPYKKSWFGRWIGPRKLVVELPEGSMSWA